MIKEGRVMNMNIINVDLPRKLTIPILENEYWYGGRVQDGLHYPFTRGADYRLQMNPNLTNNQLAPALLSTKGRAIWSKDAFNLQVIGDEMVIKPKADIMLWHDGKTLKDAQQALAKATFQLGAMPPETFFRVPQWNTWIELLYHQTQAGVMDYADQIINNGFPAGLLMIDDNWMKDYGTWEFKPDAFPDPASMVTDLHQKGFKVMLWVCPFVSADSRHYVYLRDRGLLINTSEHRPAIREWWNGVSAQLDMSHPEAIRWLKEQLSTLQKQYHIDGFKFDAGDARYWSNDDLNDLRLDANHMAQAWGHFGMQFPYNEYRANFKNTGAPLVERLQDKRHQWDGEGLNQLIPNTLTQSLHGYYYNCPDMIGGGEYLSFLSAATLGQDLIVRSAQCSAMMAMMQFSVAPWRVLDKEHLSYCQAAANLHAQLGDYIVSLAQQAASTGEPITRPLGYDFPDDHLETITDQFMLGDRYLVAPVLTKHAHSRQIVFPTGKWQPLTNHAKVIVGPTVQDVAVDLSSLPAYRKIR